LGLNFYSRKKLYQNLDRFGNFQNMTKVKKCPNGRKFAQSGHPDGNDNNSSSAYPTTGEFASLQHRARSSFLPVGIGG
jgi:hypothetical protein